MCDILFDAMVKEELLSKTTVRWLSSRKQELFPAFIKPFSDRMLIYARAKKISKFIKEINLNSLAYDDNFWAQLHFALNLREGLKPQLNKAQTTAYWFKKLRRQVRRASFIFSSLAGDEKSLATRKYIMYRRHLKSYASYQTPWGHMTTAELESRQRYGRYSSYLARLTGIAELNSEAGRLPYFITITLKPEYKKTNALFNGKTPDQSVKSTTSAVRKFSDKLRYENIDADIARVLEAQADGTPHLHLLVFTNDIDSVMRIIGWAFVDRQKISLKQGIHITPVYDLKGIISYILKSFLPNVCFFKTDTIPDEISKMKSLEEYEGVIADSTIGEDAPEDIDMITHAEQIQAWAEFSSSRRFAVLSTKRDYPTLVLWDACRRGLITLADSTFVNKHFPDDFKADQLLLAQLNKQLNDVAAAGDYAMFCRLLWLYSDNLSYCEQLSNLDNYSSIRCKSNPLDSEPLLDSPNTAETPDKQGFPQLGISNQVIISNNKKHEKSLSSLLPKTIKFIHICELRPEPDILCTH